jgi:hypothetical protein
MKKLNILFDTIISFCVCCFIYLIFHFSCKIIVSEFKIYSLKFLICAIGLYTLGIYIWIKCIHTFNLFNYKKGEKW